MAYSDDVVLIESEAWPDLPVPLRERLGRGTERIRTIRAAISRDAKVTLMPWVRINSVIWADEQGGCYHSAGRVWPTERGDEIGVQTAMGPALNEDDGLLRALLVHEFNHCFAIATRWIDHLDSKPNGPLALTADTSLDEDFERAMQVNPADWFGKEDAKEPLQWKDAKASRFSGLVLPEIVRLSNEVPALVVMRPGRYHSRNVPIPDEWATHIRSLGAR